jgi:DNA-nicking Smr family endonuclease
MARKRKKLSEEDKVLWKQVVSTVESMHGRVGVNATNNKIESSELFKTFSNLLTSRKKPSPEISKIALVHSVIPPRMQLIPLQDQSIDHKIRKKIVKGRMPIEARIDLHGMNQNSAFSRLQNFLLQAQLDEYRLVLVITGKGEAGQGILRRQVPNWLTNKDLANVVSGFQEAHISHGGSGALYVRLKRL